MLDTSSAILRQILALNREVFCSRFFTLVTFEAALKQSQISRPFVLDF